MKTIATKKMRPKKLRRSDGAQIANSNGGTKERRKADQAKGARKEKQRTRTKQKGQKTRTRKNENLKHHDGIDPLRPVSRTKTNGTCAIGAKSSIF